MPALKICSVSLPVEWPAKVKQTSEALPCHASGKNKEIVLKRVVMVIATAMVTIIVKIMPMVRIMMLKL